MLLHTKLLSDQIWTLYTTHAERCATVDASDARAKFAPRDSSRTHERWRKSHTDSPAPILGDPMSCIPPLGVSLDDQRQATNLEKRALVTCEAVKSLPGVRVLKVIRT